MTNLLNFVSTTLELKDVDLKPVFVKLKSGHKIKAHLEVEQVGKNGEMKVGVSYNSSPFIGKVVSNSRFYLTQKQMKVFEKDGESCILDVPEEDSN